MLIVASRNYIMYIEVGVLQRAAAVSRAWLASRWLRPGAWRGVRSGRVGRLLAGRLLAGGVRGVRVRGVPAWAALSLPLPTRPLRPWPVRPRPLRPPVPPARVPPARRLPATPPLHAGRWAGGATSVPRPDCPLPAVRRPVRSVTPHGQGVPRRLPRAAGRPEGPLRSAAPRLLPQDTSLGEWGVEQASLTGCLGTAAIGGLGNTYTSRVSYPG